MSRQDQGPGAPARRGAEICFKLANSRTRAPTRPRCRPIIFDAEKRGRKLMQNLHEPCWMIASLLGLASVHSQRADLVRRTSQ